MKGKRYTTEDKIRILREGDRGKSILEVCREHNISEVSFHRWKRQFGQMDLNEARKLKELERENGELKKMLAEALLRNRVLEAVAEKNGEPGASQTSGPRGGSAWAVLRAGRVSHPFALTCYFLVSASTVDLDPATAGQAAADSEREASSLRLPTHRRPFTPGRLACGQASHPATAPCRRSARAADQAQARALWCFHRTAHQSHAPQPRLDVGLCQRCHRARRSTQEAHDPRLSD